jgi:hypothetical protein
MLSVSDLLAGEGNAVAVGDLVVPRAVVVLNNGCHDEQAVALLQHGERRTTSGCRSVNSPPVW